MMLPSNVDATHALLRTGNYVADRSLATAVYLSMTLERPLFVEGEAGVGKTEIAKVLAATLQRRLLRLQCYEGLDVASAVYEWNYARQMIEIRLAEAEGGARREHLGEDVFSRRFLIERPLLQALEPEPKGSERPRCFAEHAGWHDSPEHRTKAGSMVRRKGGVPAIFPPATFGQHLLTSKKKVKFASISLFTP